MKTLKLKANKTTELEFVKEFRTDNYKHNYEATCEAVVGELKGSINIYLNYEDKTTFQSKGFYTLESAGILVECDDIIAEYEKQLPEIKKVAESKFAEKVIANYKNSYIHNIETDLEGVTIEKTSLKECLEQLKKAPRRMPDLKCLICYKGYKIAVNYESSYKGSNYYINHSVITDYRKVNYKVIKNMIQKVVDAIEEVIARQKYKEDQEFKRLNKVRDTKTKLSIFGKVTAHKVGKRFGNGRNTYYRENDVYKLQLKDKAITIDLSGENEYSFAGLTELTESQVKAIIKVLNV